MNCCCLIRENSIWVCPTGRLLPAGFPVLCRTWNLPYEIYLLNLRRIDLVLNAISTCRLMLVRYGIEPKIFCTMEGTKFLLLNLIQTKVSKIDWPWNGAKPLLGEFRNGLHQKSISKILLLAAFFFREMLIIPCYYFLCKTVDLNWIHRWETLPPCFRAGRQGLCLLVQQTDPAQKVWHWIFDTKPMSF